MREYESMNSDGTDPSNLLTPAVTSSLRGASVITPNVTAGAALVPSGSEANSKPRFQIKELCRLTDAQLGWKNELGSGSRRLES